MLDTSLNLQDEGPYREIVYYPLKLESQITVLLSAIATTIIVSLSLIFKLYKQPTSLMVLAINIVHVLFFSSKLSVLIYQPLSDTHCKIIGIFSTFGVESAAIWGALFAHAFYIILKYHSEIYLSRTMKYYLLVAVLIPALIGGSTYLTKNLVYSEIQGTCVHRVYPDRFDLTGNLFFRFPVIVACLASVVWYKMAITKLSALKGKQTSSEVYIFMIYPGIMVFCWGPHVVLQTAIQFGLSPSGTLTDAFINLTYLQGFFDALVYGKRVGVEIKKSVKKCFEKELLKEENISIVSQTLLDNNFRASSAITYSSYLITEQASDLNKTL